MDIINLIIYSDDNDYSLALGEMLSTLTDNFIIRVCGDEKELLETGNFDLLILDTCETGISEKFSNDKRVIRLADSCSEVVKNPETPEFVLYKYSGVKELASDILLYYSMLTGKKKFSRADIKSKVVAFCGGMGGVGKTAVSLASGQALRRYYSKSVLYISMEEIESTLLYINNREDGFGLCEYLYYLFKNDDKKPDCGAFMIFDKYGIGAFRPDKGRNRLRELDTEKLNVFFKEVSENGGYDYILVDMGECLGDEAKWILSICHKAAVVLSADFEKNERQKRFLNYLNFIMGESWEKKRINVINKVADRENADEEENTVYIDFDVDSIINTGEVVEISIDQDFGTGIKDLAKKIL